MLRTRPPARPARPAPPARRQHASGSNPLRRLEPRTPVTVTAWTAPSGPTGGLRGTEPPPPGLSKCSRWAGTVARRRGACDKRCPPWPLLCSSASRTPHGRFCRGRRRSVDDAGCRAGATVPAACPTHSRPDLPYAEPHSGVRRDGVADGRACSGRQRPAAAASTSPTPRFRAGIRITLGLAASASGRGVAVGRGGGTGPPAEDVTLEAK